jgi:hypothetical protein
LVRRCSENTGQTAKTGDQSLAAGWPDTREIFELRTPPCFAAPGSMTSDGKAVSFVTNLLDQV